MEIALGILSILLSGSLYVSWNLLKKFEKQEEMLIVRDDYISLLNVQVLHAVERIKELDHSGVYRVGNDEVGLFFEELVKINELLNEITGGVTTEDN